MTERKRLWFVNIPLLSIVAAILVFGTIMVNSATQGMTAGPGMLKRQALGIVIGLIGMAAVWAMDYRVAKTWIWPLFGLLVLAILSPKIPGLGDTAKGATAWLQIGSIRLFQPSEPAKLVLIVLMAAVISKYKGRLEAPADVAKVMGIMLVPLGLILLQPDLGTGLVFVAITMGMLLIGGLKARWFLVFALVGVLAAGVVLKADVLKEYQKDRLLVFVDADRDPDGAGYNLAQSKIAIGSGELTGKGLGSGTQSNLNFLPERHTDFIFSVIGEELGFLGAVILLGLYLALLVTSLEIAAQSRDLFGALIVAGIISMWLFQILENVGMTIGLMPITGIPLPFVSYGSSFLVTNLLAVGMLLSVWTRRLGTTR
ncbi:MAG: rod shape-determining protein RodA [Coriobacteriales bacterium]|nr:rod shape-determining protein RodA [Coriobacteriales bacterium]